MHLRSNTPHIYTHEHEARKAYMQWDQMYVYTYRKANLLPLHLVKGTLRNHFSIQDWKKMNKMWFKIYIVCNLQIEMIKLSVYRIKPDCTVSPSIGRKYK